MLQDIYLHHPNHLLTPLTSMIVKSLAPPLPAPSPLLLPLMLPHPSSETLPHVFLIAPNHLLALALPRSPTNLRSPRTAILYVPLSSPHYIFCHLLCLFHIHPLIFYYSQVITSQNPSLLNPPSPHPTMGNHSPSPTYSTMRKQRIGINRSCSILPRPQIYLPLLPRLPPLIRSRLLLLIHPLCLLPLRPHLLQLLFLRWVSILYISIA